MESEELKPMKNSEEIEQRLNDLKILLNSVQKKTAAAPHGHLKVAAKASRMEYYHITEHGSSRGTYIPTSNLAFAAQLAQRDYNFKLIKLLKKEIRLLENLLKQTDNFTAVQKLYSSLCAGRQKLVTPVTLPDAQYIEQWQNVSWEGKGFLEDNPKYFTAKGDRVRSKSEVIIADTLYRLRVPYRYEFPLRMRQSRSSSYTLYPDFFCLNVRTREEFIWEHFGMMDDLEYAQKAVAKLNLYAENGIIPGSNLLITMEAKTEPLDARNLEMIIQKFLI